MDIFQLSTEPLPADMKLGVAEKELIVGASAAGVDPPPTITCTDAVTVPCGLEAVRTYVVVEAGTTVRVPRRATEPIPLSIVTERAPVTLQLNCDLSPAEMLLGLASNVVITGVWPDSPPGVAGR